MIATHALARRLPDVPRWVEARDLLLSGEGVVFGLEEAPDPAFAVRDPAAGGVVVVGAPAAEAIRAAAYPVMEDATLVAAPEHAAHVAAALPTWTAGRAILHLPGPALRLPEADEGRVRLLDPDELAHLDVPEDLRRELRIGTASSPVAAAFADDRPVAFCYAGSVTESLWDVAIDTLAAYRRRGFAALAAAHMIRHMAPRRAVWGALEENPASWRLAEKLGFVPVDEVALFAPAEPG